MTKLILGVIISLSTFLYGQDTKHLQKISQEVKQIIKNENINDKKVMKKLFKIVSPKDDLLKNSYITSNISRTLFLCKRDSKCKMIEKKKSLQRMANAIESKNKLDDNSINKIYTIMDNIDFIMNKTVNEQRKRIKPKSKQELTVIIKNEINKPTSDTPDILKKLSKLYNYNFSNTIIPFYKYNLQFRKCIKKGCFKNLKDKEKKIKELNSKFPKDEVLVYVDFFEDIDSIVKIIKRENNTKKRKEENKKTKEKEKKEQAKQKIFDSLNQMSKKMGFKGYQSGISDLLYRLKNGFTEIELEKDYLWGVTQVDTFVVEGIVGKYVIYTKGNQHDFKIGILKDKNKFYQKYSYIDIDLYYKLHGIREFKTVLGVTQQILIFKVVVK